MQVSPSSVTAQRQVAAHKRAARSAASTPRSLAGRAAAGPLPRVVAGGQPAVRRGVFRLVLLSPGPSPRRRTPVKAGARHLEPPPAAGGGGAGLFVSSRGSFTPDIIMHLRAAGGWPAIAGVRAPFAWSTATLGSRHVGDARAAKL